MTRFRSPSEHPFVALAMGDDDKQSKPKHRRSHRDDEREHKSKKRHRHGDVGEKRKHKKPRDKSDKGLEIVDDDPNDEDMWVEKNIDMDGERVCSILFCVVFLAYIYDACSYLPPTYPLLRA